MTDLYNTSISVSFTLNSETTLDLFIRASNTGEVSIIDAGNIKPYDFHRGLLVKTQIRNNVQDKSETDRTYELLVQTSISESTIR